MITITITIRSHDKGPTVELEGARHDPSPEEEMIIANAIRDEFLKVMQDLRAKTMRLNKTDPRNQ